MPTSKLPALAQPQMPNVSSTGPAMPEQLRRVADCVEYPQSGDRDLDMTAEPGKYWRGFQGDGWDVRKREELAALALRVAAKEIQKLQGTLQSLGRQFETAASYAENSELREYFEAAATIIHLTVPTNIASISTPTEAMHANFLKTETSKDVFDSTSSHGPMSPTIRLYQATQKLEQLNPFAPMRPIHNVA